MAIAIDAEVELREQPGFNPSRFVRSRGVTGNPLAIVDEHYTADCEPRLKEGFMARRRRRDGIAETRGFLYALARLLGDVQAVRKGRVGRRVGRRVTGKATGRALRKLFR